jgi:hypothetical protein
VDLNESGNLVVNHNLIYPIIVLAVTVIALRLMWRILRANWPLIAFWCGVLFLVWWLTTGPDDPDPPVGPHPVNTLSGRWVIPKRRFHTWLDSVTAASDQLGEWS